MVSINIQGGLGNILFQKSMVLAYSLKHGVDYCIPLSNINPHYIGQKPYIFPGIKYCDKVADLPVYNEKSFCYEEIPLMDNVCFSGYFQSWKYFDVCREEILKAFGFEYGKCEGLVSVHVRRGDYLKTPTKHPVITKEYIESAMELFAGKEFCFFTDDPKWVKENFGHRKDWQLESSDNEILDLVNASCCENNIGSNSTFSWWVYYLNQNPDKIGVFPKKWFGPDLSHDTQDLLLPTCITM